MPKKKRPVFEYKGLAGLFESIDNVNVGKQDSTPSRDPPFSDDLPAPSRSRHGSHHRHRHRRHHHHRHRHHPSSRRHRSKYRDYHRSRARDEQVGEGGEPKPHSERVSRQQPPAQQPLALDDDHDKDSYDPSPENSYTHHSGHQPHPAAMGVAAHAASTTAAAPHYPQPGGNGAPVEATNQPHYPQPGNAPPTTTHNTRNAAAAIAAAATGAALAADAAAHSGGGTANLPGPGGTIPPSAVHSRGAYLDAQIPDDDGRSEAGVPIIMAGDVRAGAAPPPPHSARYSQAQGPPDSFPQRLKSGFMNLLPKRGRMQVPVQGDEGYMISGMSDGRSRLSRPGVATGGPSTGLVSGAGGITGLTHGIPTTDAVSRPAVTDAALSKDQIDKEKRHRTFTKAAKIAAVAAAGMALSTAWKGWVSKKEKKKKRRKNGGTHDSDDDDDEGEDEQSEWGETRGGNSNPLKLRPPRKNSFGGMVHVPQGEAYVVERGGKFHRKLNGGSAFLIPFSDKVTFRHSLREIGVPIDLKQCYTRDSVRVKADALMFVRIADPVEASYSVHDLHQSILMMGISCMTREISKSGMKDLFTKRDAVSERIATKVNEAARPWGVRCTRFDITDMEIPEEMQETMEREAQAERMRNADILFSEGQRQALINKADGEMQAQMRMSQARQMDIVNQAIGEAHAIQERGEAIASAMRDVAEAVKEPGGDQAMKFRLAEQYLNACSHANNGDVTQDPAKVLEAMKSSLGLLSALGDPSANVANPYVAPNQRRGPDGGGSSAGGGVGDRGSRTGPVGPQPGGRPGFPPHMSMPHPTGMHHEQAHYMGEDGNGNDDVDQDEKLMMKGRRLHAQMMSGGGMRRGDDDYNERGMGDTDGRVGVGGGGGMRRTDGRSGNRDVGDLYEGVEQVRERRPGRDGLRRTTPVASHVEDRFSSRESSTDYEARMQSPAIRSHGYGGSDSPSSRAGAPGVGGARRRVTTANGA